MFSAKRRFDTIDRPLLLEKLESCAKSTGAVQRHHIAVNAFKRDNKSEGGDMQNRERAIILYFLNNESVSFETLLKHFGVSRRTLYYDLSKINKRIEPYGEIIKVDARYKLIGDVRPIEALFLKDAGEDFQRYLEYEARREKVLTALLTSQRVDRAELAREMLISESTVVQTIKKLKGELSAEGVSLYYDNGYKLKGDEVAIRAYFLKRVVPKVEGIEAGETVEQFNRAGDLQLTDFAKVVLRRFLDFLIRRLSEGCCLMKCQLYESATALPYHPLVAALLPTGVGHCEHCYLTAYISTLPSLKATVPNQKSVALAETLLLEVEQRVLIAFNNKRECLESLARHLRASFYRIKFHFPVTNPLVEEIKLRYELLFKLIANIFQTSVKLSELKGIEEDEIAFIVFYIGAYIERDALEVFEKKRVVIVCPNGITVTRTLQYQIENHFPQMEIVGVMSYSEFKKRPPEDADWVISTMDIEGRKRMIHVNPILRNSDLSRISQSIFKAPFKRGGADVGELIETFQRYGTIDDLEGLTQALYKHLYKTTIEKRGYIMLKDLLVREHLQLTDSVSNWREGIRMAAVPLLEKGTIEPRYVEAMIEGVEKFGPYIVLTDYFAFAHARPEDGVKEVSMSLLKVDNAFDMLGKPVKIIVVLAATDNSKHLKALASLTELFMEASNVEQLVAAHSVEELLTLIEHYS